ncbi:aspartate kinase [Hansschlegelia sp. KR7-227]|uniref:amino acid kinase family protein n=1 Tax=Hansschlegelia sp. KR7-227 TaxID=3400914 RepID=UPI003BFBDA55
MHALVKFGGSLLGSALLQSLLDVATRRGAIVVPGGGPFADAVRDEQARLGFGDAAAHRMAILAMDQVACVLAERAPSLVSCATADDFAAARLSGRPTLWRPSVMALAADLPACWDVTSDSLALWLATELGVARTILLKSALVPPGGSPDEWAKAGVIDPHAPILARAYRGDLQCLGPADPAALDAALGAPRRIAA